MIRLARSEASNSFILSFSVLVPSSRCLSSSYASSISSRRPFVSQAGRFGFALGFGPAPSLDGGRDTSDPLDTGRAVALLRVAGALVPGPTLFDIPAETTRLGATGVLAVGGFAPGPMVLERVFRVAGPVFGTVVLRDIGSATGLAANCFGATALSARVIRFAGGFNPVSGS